MILSKIGREPILRKQLFHHFEHLALATLPHPTWNSLLRQFMVRNRCRKEFHLKVAGFLGPPLFMNIIASNFFSRKSIISCFQNFNVMFSLFTIKMHVIPKTLQRAWLHKKVRLHNKENNTKNSIYSFTSLDGPSAC